MSGDTNYSHGTINPDSKVHLAAEHPLVYYPFFRIGTICKASTASTQRVDLPISASQITPKCTVNIRTTSKVSSVTHLVRKFVQAIASASTPTYYTTGAAT